MCQTGQEKARSLEKRDVARPFKRFQGISQLSGAVGEAFTQLPVLSQLPARPDLPWSFGPQADL